VKAKLRKEYLALLRSSGATPLRVPENAREIQERVAAEQIAAAERAGDAVYADVLRRSWETNRERYAAEKTPPDERMISAAVRAVERSIRRIPRYANTLGTSLYCGPFPTGTVNAQVVSTPSGFIILVNTGALTMLQQVCTLLAMAQPDRLADPANAEVVTGIVDVLAAYILYGDSLFGAKPLPVSLTQSLLAQRLKDACLKFIIAHEYGHIVAGHLAPAETTQTIRIRAAGDQMIPVIKKSLVQELEADRIGHYIILGAEDYSRIDLRPIDLAYDAEKFSFRVFDAGVSLKCALTAPLILFVIMGFIEDVLQMLPRSEYASAEERTHPPARGRAENLHDVLRLGSRYVGYFNLVAPLIAAIDDTEERIAKRVLAG
jgi:Peptidase family M48